MFESAGERDALMGRVSTASGVSEPGALATGSSDELIVTKVYLDPVATARGSDTVILIPSLPLAVLTRLS